MTCECPFGAHLLQLELKRILTKPDRIIVGTDNPCTTELRKSLYEPFNRSRDHVISMDIRSAALQPTPIRQQRPTDRIPSVFWTLPVARSPVGALRPD